jgi:hypothetical protein
MKLLLLGMLMGFILSSGLFSFIVWFVLLALKTEGIDYTRTGVVPEDVSGRRSTLV